MLIHLNAIPSVLPIDFWEQVFSRLAAAQIGTDIAVYFPTEENGCPDYLKKPS